MTKRSSPPSLDPALRAQSHRIAQLSTNDLLSMSITVVKEHGQVRILRIDGEVPPDRPVQLFTQDEILARPGLSPMERLQLESILRDEEDWEELLDPHILSEQG